LVTFRTPAAGSVVYMDDVASELLKLIGRTGSAPGALRAQDTAAAAQALRRALTEIERRPEDANKSSASGVLPHAEHAGEAEDEGDTVPLRLRALPLLDLLDRATDANDYVVWDSE